MPLRDPKKYLYDIINCCEFLLEFTKTKTVEDYKNDRAFRSAVERELQVIGEAITQLDRISPETADKISEHRNIIAMFLFTAMIVLTLILFGMLLRSSSISYLLKPGIAVNNYKISEQKIATRTPRHEVIFGI
jgi:hypothetical protein